MKLTVDLKRHFYRFRRLFVLVFVPEAFTRHLHHILRGNNQLFCVAGINGR